MAARFVRRRDEAGRERDSDVRLRDGQQPGAAAIVLIATAVICLVIKVSCKLKLVIVTITIAAVLFVILAGFFWMNTSNHPP